MIIYFTGTGNSRFVAEELAQRLQDECVCSNEYMKVGQIGEFVSERPWVFVFPVYVSTMAEIFRRFIEAARFKGCRQAYFVATCAGDMGMSVDVGRKICEKKGWVFMGAEGLRMPQNYIVYFPMTKAEEIRRRLENARQDAERIADVITQGETLGMKGRSAVERVATEAVEKLYNRFFTSARGFRTTEACVGCGLCVKVCPLNNVRLVKGRPVWGKECVHCMGCINRCPKKAVEYGKWTVGKERYSGPQGSP